MDLIDTTMQEIARQTERTNRILVGLLLSVVTAVIVFTVLNLIEIAQARAVTGG